MAIEDPIVDEVRETRERLMAEAGGFDEYIRKLKSLEVGDAARLVTQTVRHEEMQKATHCAEDGPEYRGRR